MKLCIEQKLATGASAFNVLSKFCSHVTGQTGSHQQLGCLFLVDTFYSNDQIDAITYLFVDIIVAIIVIRLQFVGITAFVSAK